MNSRRTKAKKNYLISTREAAPLLEVSPGTLEVWRNTGRGTALPHVKLGNRIRYRHSDVKSVKTPRK